MEKMKLITCVEFAKKSFLSSLEKKVLTIIQKGVHVVIQREEIDTDKKCKYDCFYEELCEKNDEDTKLCSKIKKDINLADNIDMVEYSDIENVRKYVD